MTHTKHPPYSQPAPAPGVYEGLPYHVYASWDAINQSFLKDMDETPATAIHNKTHQNPDEDEKSHYRIGRAMHTLTTQPESFDTEYIVKPKTLPGKATKADIRKGLAKKEGDVFDKPWDGSLKACKSKMALWLSEGLTLIAPKEHDKAKGMADSLREHPLVKDILEAGYYELSIVWVDQATGLICKARFDAYKNGGILDWKSTKRAINGTSMMYEATNFKYYLQMHHYEQGAMAADLAEYPQFEFFFVRSKGPYLCDHYKPDISLITDAKIEWERLMKRTARCIETGVWPGLYDPNDEKTWTKDLMAAPSLGTKLGWEGS